MKSDIVNKEKIAADIKSGLESLEGRIPGLISIHVQSDNILPSSNADIMLDSCFESHDALKNYAVHPNHLAIANSAVRPFTEVRLCLDFEDK